MVKIFIDKTVFFMQCIYSKNVNNCAFIGEPRIALSQLDPLRVSRMHIKQGGNSPVNLDLNFRDVELIGLKHFICTSVRYLLTHNKYLNISRNKTLQILTKFYWVY